MSVTASKKLLWRFLKLSVLFAFLHWFLMCFSIVIVVGRGVHRLDHPEFPKTALEQICKIVIPILEQPSETFIRMAHHPGGWVATAFGLTNGLLWGSAFASIYLLMRQQVKQP